MDTRSKKPQALKDEIIANAQRKISVYDRMIEKQGVGRPRTRTRDSLGGGASNYTTSNVEDFVYQLTGAKQGKK